MPDQPPWNTMLWQHGTAEWPGYPRERQRIAYPSWAEAKWLEREVAEAGAS